MDVVEIVRRRYAKRVISEKDYYSRLEIRRHFEIQEELGKSLLAVMHQTATNRDHAKLLRHGYQDMYLRTNEQGEVVGVRYTKDGRTIILPFPVVIYRAMVRKLCMYNSDWDASKRTASDKVT